MMILKSGDSRRGAIAPMTALFSVFLLAMVAFAVDTSWMVLSQSELQNAADASALAGAQKLMNNYVLYTLGSQSAATKATLLSDAIASAQTTAKAYAASNGAGGNKSLTLLDSDLSVGYTDSAGNYTAYTTGGKYPNTVKVKIRRDSSANSSLNLFFAPVLGMKSLDLAAPATATIYTGVVNSYKPPTDGQIMMLPMTLDVNDWKNFLKTGQALDGSVMKDANGNPQLQIYPSVKDEGNFGELSLNDSHVGASTTNSWITNGMGASDVNDLLNANLLPLTAHDATLWDWQGNPGFKSSNVQNVNDDVGTITWLPLFTPKSTAPDYQAGVGQGSNYNYNIVAFVPVQVMQPDSFNRQIVVQPAPMADRFAVFDQASIVPAGESSSAFATVLPPRLTN